MRIKTLADATGVEVDTIRYYASTHLERLAFIRHCRTLEMPLVDIRTLLGALDAPGEPHPDVDRLVQEQIDKVRVRLQSMRALEKQLLLLQASCGGCSDQGTDCGILKELVAAAHGEACVCHSHASI
jgi:DNA-binding transcriptional MerR regulator